MKKLRVLSLVGVLVFAISLMALAPVYADRRRHPKKYYRPPYHRPNPGKAMRIRFTDRDIDRLIVIGGIYFLSKAISEASRPRKKIVCVSPPPSRYVYVPSPQPSYTPSVCSTIVTVRNATNWYVTVTINGTQLNLAPGYEQVVSWTYTSRGQYIEARAYQDRRHKWLVGTYQGNLVGYQIPWKLNFDCGSFG